MKFVKIISICLAVCVLLSACSSTKTDKSTTMSENTTGNTDAVKTYSQEQLDALNACYEPIVDCQKNGFDKTKSEEYITLFKTALSNGVSHTLYKDSLFNNQSISFSFRQQHNYTVKQEIEHYHCRDLLLAMYLACVLATEPQNLASELELLKDGIWFTFEEPEFVHLIASCYPVDDNELDIVNQAIIDFTNTLKCNLDKIYTGTLILSISALYKEAHPDSEYNVVEKFKEPLDELHYMTVEYDEYPITSWVGYGKIITEESVQNNPYGYVVICEY